jgi:hypothetical protein
MANMPPGGQNKSSMKGMAKASGHPKSVAEDEGHAGERSVNKGVVFTLPKDSECTDHSKIRSLS